MRNRVCALFVLCAGIAFAQPQQIRVEPLHDSGQSVTAAFEGWFQNADGTFSILFGYFNRNAKEELDIAVGAENKIEPGPPDQGQPTHFLPRRQWGMFTVPVPKDFGKKKLTWTITANGVTTSIPGSLDLLWEIAPFKDATENTPPYASFSEQGPFVYGPAGLSTALKAVAGTPLPLTLFVGDDARLVPGAPRPRTPAASISWAKFRGPGSVTFSSDKPNIEPSVFTMPVKPEFQGKATNTVTFSEPGEYVIRAGINDWTGEGGRGFQCCWTNAQVKVSVTAPGK